MYTHKLLLYFGYILLLSLCNPSLILHYSVLPIVKTFVHFIYFPRGIVPKYLRIFGNGTNSFYRYFQNLNVFGTIPTADIFIDGILQEQVKMT